MKAEAKIRVSVLVPCRNEVEHIKKCIENLFEFDPPQGGFEVIVIDGMSDDGTRDILTFLKKRYSALVVVDNPMKTVPYAMNIGIQTARGEYIVRADVRCVHPKGYLNDLLKLKEETHADNVGGTLIAVGETYVQKAVASAYRSPIAVGNALGATCEGVREVDDVYGGCFERGYLVKLGMYDEKFVRNQDDELSFRLRKHGGRIMQAENIQVLYKPRKHFGQLFKQFFQYGYWKVYVVRKHPQQASLRHFIPSVFVLLILGLTAASFFSSAAAIGLLASLSIYVISLSFEAIRISRRRNILLSPGIVVAIIAMHTGYGIGFIFALIGEIFKIRFAWSEALSR